MNFIAQLIIIFLKFAIPVLILKFPFAAVWSNYFLDVVDGDILLFLGMSDSTYQVIDKLADYVSYIFMLIVGLRWRVSRIIIALFVYRTIGQILFFTTGNELSLFYFQNFLEPLVMIYAWLIFKKKSEQKAYQVYKNRLILIWSIIIVYKVWNEWTLHFANIDLSQLFLGFTGG